MVERGRCECLGERDSWVGMRKWIVDGGSGGDDVRKSCPMREIRDGDQRLGV